MFTNPTFATVDEMLTALFSSLLDAIFRIEVFPMNTIHISNFGVYV